MASTEMSDPLRRTYRLKKCFSPSRSLLRPNVGRVTFKVNDPDPLTVDLLTIAGIAMLALWAAGTFAFDAPGLIHGLLTLGVFCIVLAAVKRAERARRAK